MRGGEAGERPPASPPTNYSTARPDVAAYGPLGARGSDAAPLVRINTVKDCPSKGIKLGIVCVPEAQISRILAIGIAVGHLPLSASVSVGLRRRDASRGQHQSRCEDSGDLGSHCHSPQFIFCRPLLSGRTNRSSASDPFICAGGALLIMS